MDPNILKRFFAYNGKIFTFYDKIILPAHWPLINYGFTVKDQDNEVTNYTLFY
jgi:hypothetical protein